MSRCLWLASTNEHKRIELARLLAPLGYVLRLQSEAPGASAVVEDRPDFQGNAALKANALATLVRAPALADDSGLCVDALGGRPGVHSARYGGSGATDRERVAKLLAELVATPPHERTARFVCHLCLADARGRIVASIEETCEGVITNAPRGERGFGYDPVFVATDHLGVEAAATFAELTAAQKDAVSHRGKALRRLVEHLQLHPLPGAAT